MHAHTHTHAPVSPHVDHGVEDAGAAEDLAPGPVAAVADHGEAVGRVGGRGRLVHPVELGELHVAREGRHVRDLVLVAPGLQEQDLPVRDLGEAVRDNGAGRAAADHYEVVRAQQLEWIVLFCFISFIFNFTRFRSIYLRVENI